MTAFYNEIDPYAAAWLRNLIAAGHIAPGVVDERDIRDIEPRELSGYTQCHFFAGIGVWSYALRLAGWPDERPVWTGSCPCQPFSAAGLGAGFADERHLWPSWYHLIRQQRPCVVFGEQVASADGLAWLDLVHTDLETARYSFAALDMCAAGVGAPHIRQRLWLVADTEREGPQTRAAAELPRARRGHEGRKPQQPGASRPDDERAGALHGFWRQADWLLCGDGLWRPVEPGAFPLAPVAPARVGKLRAYGNAVVAEVAAEWIGAYLDVRG